METSMFERMQSLPLLQGLTLQDFSDLILNMKLDFKKLEEGDVIVGQSDHCNNLIYIIDGEFEAELHDDTTALILSETCAATPHLIEPYNLFGVKRSFERSYVFKTNGSTFSISREFFMQRMLHNNIVRSNYINYLCNNLRKAHTMHMAVPSDSIESKIKSVIASFCLFPQGEKNVRVKMNDLAALVDETRLNVSNVLNKWNNMGIIELRRYGFTIKEFAKL